jgi:hypothetical protein
VSSINGDKYSDLMRILEGGDDHPLSTFKLDQCDTVPLRYTASNMDDEYTSSAKNKLMEMEIEREESQKALEVLKELRDRERNELRAMVEKTKEDASKQTEDVKNEMAKRMEK